MSSNSVHSDLISFGVIISIAGLVWFITSKKEAEREVKYKWTGQSEDDTPIDTIKKYFNKIKRTVINVPFLTSGNIIFILIDIATDHFNMYYDCFLLMEKLKNTAGEENMFEQVKNLFDGKSFQSRLIASKIKILEKHQVDLDTFESSLVTYLENPEVSLYTKGIEMMQEDVLNNLPPLMPGVKLDIKLQGKKAILLWNRYLELEELYAKHAVGLFKPDVDLDFYKILNEAHLSAEEAFLKNFEVPSMYHLKHAICLHLRTKPESIHELHVINNVHLDKMNNITQYIIDLNYSNKKFKQISRTQLESLLYESQLNDPPRFTIVQLEDQITDSIAPPDTDWGNDISFVIANPYNISDMVKNSKDGFAVFKGKDLLLVTADRKLVNEELNTHKSEIEENEDN